MVSRRVAAATVTEREREQGFPVRYCLGTCPWITLVGMSIAALPRRRFLQTSAAAVAAAGLSRRIAAADAASGLKGRINHSACKWCYPKVPFDELCRAGKEMGLTSIDLVDPPDFDTMKKHGLTSAMISYPSIAGPNGEKVGSIPFGFNNPAFHDLLVQAYEPLIKASADFGAKHVICFSGNRNGMDDETGLKNCAAGLKKILPVAEKHGITLVMELLNSKVNHKDYMCDHSAWGVELCKRIGSPNFKLLYDIYHMQIMEGDVIATIKAQPSSSSPTTTPAACRAGTRSTTRRSCITPRSCAPSWTPATRATSRRSSSPQGRMCSAR